MTAYEHYFSDLEKKYYNFYLKNRKTNTKKLMPKIDDVYKNFVNKLYTSGYVEISNVIDRDELSNIESQVIKYFSNNNVRVLDNPLKINGLYDLIKKYLAPFACQYYECIPTISYLKIIKSSTSKSPKDTQFFHRDPGSYKLLKAIIYLNDVDSFGGPLVYVDSSHTESLKGMSGRKRIVDNIVSKKYNNQVKEIIGHKGHITFFDAKGLHKGKLPEKNDRLAIIVNFSLHPEYGQKDNYTKLTYDMNEELDEFDLTLLDSCMPIFGVKNE